MQKENIITYLTYFTCDKKYLKLNAMKALTNMSSCDSIFGICSACT